MKTNFNLIEKIVSLVLAILGFAFLLPAATGFIYKEFAVAKTYLLLAALMVALGFAGVKLGPKSKTEFLKIKDGFTIVALSWILVSVLGALPFVISGDIPHYVDAVFETASGFSTTGATSLTNVEVLSHAGLMWRSFTHWLGGMGLLVMTIALLPKLGIGGQKLMRAESTGISLEKSNFTFSKLARNLYKIYIGFTLAEIILLMVAGLPLFDAMIHTFGSVGTGGFSNYNASVGAYNSIAVELIIVFFMLVCGMNFSNLTVFFKGKVKTFFRDTELRVYLAIVAASTVIIAVILTANHYYSAGASLRYSLFQVVSIMTTTGYGTCDFNLWPEACKTILVLLMIIGACAGSTAGGIKVIRLCLMGKLVNRAGIRKMHPSNVIPIKLGKTKVADEIVIDSCGFLALYFIVAAVSTILLSLDGADIITAFTSVISALSNIGPGLNMVGPASNYAFYSDPSKILLSLLMIAGRLELFTMFMLFV